MGCYASTRVEASPARLVARIVGDVVHRAAKGRFQSDDALDVPAQGRSLHHREPPAAVLDRQDASISERDKGDRSPIAVRSDHGHVCRAVGDRGVVEYVGHGTSTSVNRPRTVDVYVACHRTDCGRALE